MKIEILKKYNQWILAIAGTIGLLFLTLAIAIGAIEMVNNLWENNLQPEQTQIISEEKAQENLQKNLRTHLVHFRKWNLLDTARQVYAIPVSQSLLDESETFDDGVLGLVGSGSSIRKRSSYGYYGYSRANFNNLLIFDAKSSESKALFSKRVSINQVFYEKIMGESYLLMSVITQDTNKDGILDESDLKNLFIYATKDASLQEVTFENSVFLNYGVLEDRPEIFVRFGIDKNKNGKYNWDEVAVLQRYSLLDKKLTRVVSPELMQQLQAVLDGKTIKQ